MSFKIFLRGEGRCLSRLGLYFALIILNMSGCSGIAGIVTETLSSDTTEVSTTTAGESGSTEVSSTTESSESETSLGSNSATDAESEAQIDTPSDTTDSLDSGITAPSSGEGEIDIQAYIPPPANDGTLVSAPDSQGVAYLTANGLEDGYVLVTELNTTSASRFEESVIALWNGYIANSCYAQDASDETTDTMSVCDNANTSCATIADGRAETSLSGCTMASTISYYYLNSETGATSDAVEDQPLENLIYMADGAASAKAIVSDGGIMYAVTEQSKLIRMSYDAEESRFLMNSGTIEDGYTLADAVEGTTELDYDPSKEIFVMKKSGDDVDDELVAMRLNGESLEGYSEETCYLEDGSCSSREICSEADGCTPTVVKVRGGKVYFGTRYSTDQDIGRIRELLDDNSNKFEFFSTAENDDYNFREVAAFDVGVDSSNIRKDYLVAFKDESENFRILGKYKMTGVTSHLLALVDVTAVHELEIVTSQSTTSPCTLGEAVVLTDSKLQFLTYNFFPLSWTRLRGCDEPGITAATSLSVSNPIAMALNADKTHAFILSNGEDATTHTDDYVTVVDLATAQVETDWPLLSAEGQISLASQFSGKTITDFNPDFLHVMADEDSGGEFLIVGSQALKSSIVIELPTEE